MSFPPIQRALLSVSNKEGIVTLAKKLHESGVEILSTGGTAKLLEEADIPVIQVSDFTGFPELFSGRVKTLHPKIHGGILFQRGSEKDQKEATEHKIPPIDLLIVNLYPFQETIAKEGCILETAVEQIDIGGVALLRAGAKNHRDVTVICDPKDYAILDEEMAKNKNATTEKTRLCLAAKALRHTAEYDTVIADYLKESTDSPTRFSLDLPLDSHLRYGENPHQKASLYGSFSEHFDQLQGKDLSYTNVLDISSAASLINDFKRPTVAILKHTNPCGVGCDDEDLRAAWKKAFETDTQAPFGGVIVCNRPMDEGLARMICEIFTDVIIAPEFLSQARAILQKKKNLRLIRMDRDWVKHKEDPVVRSVPGGMLVMDPDPRPMGLSGLEKKVVTKRPPTEHEIEAMRFAWRVVRHVKSNAIVYATHDRTLGIGAGQMSRVDASRIAITKAENAGLSLKGSVVASDAMFPFPDGLLMAAEAGATSAIQPGGSIKDNEVIDAADQNKLAMVFTEHRHFLH